MYIYIYIYIRLCQYTETNIFGKRLSKTGVVSWLFLCCNSYEVIL